VSRTDPPILVALDMPTAERAVRLARDLAPHVGGFKIGLRLLHGPGPGTVAALAGLGKPVFADAKLHDVPSQAEAAAAKLGEIGARWVTVHATGGVEMLEAAVAGAARGSSGRCGVLGVTVLTSLDGPALKEIGVDLSPGKLVSRLARLVDAAGCEGVVCSAQEVRVVHDVAARLLKVVPGIRPEGSVAGDQRRTGTPTDTLARGADWLVIGRPIVEAADPVAAVAGIVASLDPSSGHRPG